MTFERTFHKKLTSGKRGLAASLYKISSNSSENEKILATLYPTIVYQAAYEEESVNTSPCATLSIKTPTHSADFSEDICYIQPAFSYKFTASWFSESNNLKPKTVRGDEESVWFYDY